jgi:predicted transcriptional regulator
MAEKANNNVIVLPIHPKYANAIMDGTKKVEFRKINIPESIKYIVVYSTAPQKKVIGYFSVRGIVKTSPAALWEQFGSMGMINEKAFFEYYAGQQYGLGILVGDVSLLGQPCSFPAVNGDLNVPQSFAYCSSNDWRNLKRRKKVEKPKVV